jgi:exopolysaccharide production protein ExoZ
MRRAGRDVSGNYLQRYCAIEEDNLTRKINNIQALRAYAAVAVVLWHTGFIFPHMLQMGKFGVDIFFVISGYIMARICEGDTRFFLRRRLIRIVPPYWAMTLLLFCFSLFFPRFLLSTSANPSDLLRSLLFIPYYREDGLIRPLLYIGWSLNYEILFYLLITVGIYLLPKHPLAFATGLLVSLQLVCSHYAGLGAVPMCYSSNVVYEFVLGVVAYEIARRVSSSAATAMRPFSLIALGGSLAGIVFLQGVAHAPLPAEWFVMQLLAMLTILSASLLSQGDWDIRMPWIVIVGDASFVLYLTHPYILSLSDRVLSRFFPEIQMSHAGTAFTLIALSTVAATFFHLKLEKPTVSYLNRRLGGHRRTAEFSRLQVTPEQVAP